MFCLDGEERVDLAQQRREYISNRFTNEQGPLSLPKTDSPTVSPHHLSPSSSFYTSSSNPSSRFSGAFFFFGGLLMVIGAILEFVLGNTFPFVVFGTFGAFWLTYGATLTPYYNASGAYSPTDPTVGGTDPTFMTSFAFFLLWMAFLCLVYLICSLRTNIVFFMIFLLLVPAFCCLAGSFWHGAQGNAATALALQHAGGALSFAVCLLGWYLFLVLLLASVDFPLNLPVGDLSRLIKGGSEKTKAS